MGIQDRVEEHLERLLPSVNEWLRFAEAKNGVLLALATAGAATIFGLLFSEHGPATCYGRRVLISYAAVLALSALISGASFLPYLQLPWFLRPRPEKRTPNDNLLFFGHITNYSAKVYATCFTERYYGESGADATRLILDISDQLIANSRITVWKLRLFAWALSLIIIGLILSPILWTVL